MIEAEWESEVEKELDFLVAKNFIRLYEAKDSEYTQIWGEISRKLHEKYDLLKIELNDPEYSIKKQKQHFVGMSVEIYHMEEFPTELSDPRTYRFVKQYGKLPKQAQNEWKNFELEKRIIENEKTITDEEIREAIKKLNQIN